MSKLPITVVIAAKNEVKNIEKCLASVKNFERVILADSQSSDGTIEVAKSHGAEVVQFHYQGGYPKKRQWVLDTLPISTPWVLMLDADEVIPASLEEEIATAIERDEANGYLIKKGFHFLGRRFRFGGFSHAALILFRRGTARFEHLLDEPENALDMEVHERVIASGTIRSLKTPLIHEDFKGLEAYVDRHNKYSTWDALARWHYLTEKTWGEDAIRPRLFGNTQERRRFLKQWMIRFPLEPLIWFVYHYLVRLGCLEGLPGLIACRIRANYICDVRAKVYELKRVARNETPPVEPAPTPSRRETEDAPQLG